jgi:hypothetical protein
MISTDGKIKYFRIADGILDSAMEEQEKARAAGRNKGGARGTSFMLTIESTNNQVEEADQVEEVQEEVSYHHNLRTLEANEQDEADHQVAEEEEDQDAEHQEEEEAGDSREWEGNQYSHRDRYHRCQYYADSFESAGGREARMGKVVG